MPEKKFNFQHFSFVFGFINFSAINCDMHINVKRAAGNRVKRDKNGRGKMENKF